MSALIGHAKAAKILADSFEEVGSRDAGFPELAASAITMLSMAGAYRLAANRMEQAMREEATGREDLP